MKLREIQRNSGKCREMQRNVEKYREIQRHNVGSPGIPLIIRKIIQAIFIVYFPQRVIIVDESKWVTK